MTASKKSGNTSKTDLTPSELAKRCIACDKKRVKDSGFCAKHKAEHKKSPWVKAWRKYQVAVAKAVAKSGPSAAKKVPWVPPKAA